MEQEQKEEKPKSPCGRGKEHKAHPDCTCGTPGKYTNDEDMLAKVDEYLATCEDVERELDKGYSVKVKLPKRVGLANYLGVVEDTLNSWGKKHEKFLGALKKIDQLQQERLIDSGLSGDYNPTIAKLLLSANHGMREKSDVTTDDKPMMQGIEISFTRAKKDK